MPKNKYIEKIKQLEVQLAGCSVAALGCVKYADKIGPGDYGWSPAFKDVLELREKYDELVKQSEATIKKQDEFMDRLKGALDEAEQME